LARFRQASSAGLEGLWQPRCRRVQHREGHVPRGTDRPRSQRREASGPPVQGRLHGHRAPRVARRQGHLVRLHPLARQLGLDGEVSLEPPVPQGLFPLPLDAELSRDAGLHRPPHRGPARPAAARGAQGVRLHRHARLRHDEIPLRGRPAHRRRPREEQKNGHPRREHDDPDHERLPESARQLHADPGHLHSLDPAAGQHQLLHRQGAGVRHPRRRVPDAGGRARRGARGRVPHLRQVRPSVQHDLRRLAHGQRHRGTALHHADLAARRPHPLHRPRDAKLRRAGDQKRHPLRGGADGREVGLGRLLQAHGELQQGDRVFPQLAGDQPHEISAGHRQQRGALPRRLLPGGRRPRPGFHAERKRDLRDHAQGLRREKPRRVSGAAPRDSVGRAGTVLLRLPPVAAELLGHRAAHRHAEPHLDRAVQHDGQGAGLLRHGGSVREDEHAQPLRGRLRGGRRGSLAAVPGV